jgi:hypothetical protein
MGRHTASILTFIGVCMFIVWGKKYVYRKVGYVADLCQMCRGIRAFQLRRVGLASHVYYLTASEGELVRHERTCQNCKTVLVADPNKYATIGKRIAPVDELQRNTYPTLPAVAADYLALREKMQKTPAFLTSTERQELLYAPFHLMSSKVEQFYANIKIDKTIGLSMLGVVVFFMVVPGIVEKIAPASAPDALLIMIGVSALFIVWQFITAGQRYLRNQIIPPLAQAIRPLHPTENELRGILDNMRKRQHKLGEKLKLKELLAHLETMRRG